MLNGLRNRGVEDIFIACTEELRELIYTTNAIEGFNRQLRKVTKSKSVFPTDDSLLRVVPGMKNRPELHTSGRFAFCGVLFAFHLLNHRLQAGIILLLGNGSALQKQVKRVLFPLAGLPFVESKAVFV